MSPPPGRRRLTLVLAVLTVLALSLSVPGSLREAWERGGFYVFSREFFTDLPRRLTGPGRFRFVLQPAFAIAIGIAAGRADARAGRPPYLYALIRDREGRRERLREAFRSIAHLVARGRARRLRVPVADPGRVVPGRRARGGPGADRAALLHRAGPDQPSGRGPRAPRPLTPHPIPPHVGGGNCGCRIGSAHMKRPRQAVVTLPRPSWSGRCSRLPQACSSCSSSGNTRCRKSSRTR